MELSLANGHMILTLPFHMHSLLIWEKDLFFFSELHFSLYLQKLIREKILEKPCNLIAEFSMTNIKYNVYTQIGLH